MESLGFSPGQSTYLSQALNHHAFEQQCGIQEVDSVGCGDGHPDSSRGLWREQVVSVA